MDRRVSESHSDSDSGDSWTLLDSAPSYTATESRSPSPALDAAQAYREGAEKDDDTDGISIISDCESEASEPCEHVQRVESASVVAVTPVDREPDDDAAAADYRHLLGDVTKLKTYVHRRNTRVSAALNVIVLGSVVTAACLAIGHMWGVRDDCLHQSSAAAVNKLLSNLYKLREENAHLRSKLKELTTAAGRAQLPVKRNSTPRHCEKTLEEPKIDADKCVDPDAEIDRPLLKYVKAEPKTLPRRRRDVDIVLDLQKVRKSYGENGGGLARRPQSEKDAANGRVERATSRRKANAEIPTEKGGSVEGNGYFRGDSNSVPASTSFARDKFKRRLKRKIVDDGVEGKRRERPKRERADPKIKNDDDKREAENGNGHGNVKNRERDDSKHGPIYDADRFSHSGRQDAKKRRRESKTSFLIVDRESDGTKKKKTNDSADDLALSGEWLERRSAMRGRARQLHGLMSARWYFLRMRDREQLRARPAHEAPRH